MRVIVERGGDEGTRDCYGALGLIHSLWKPMPGRFKDYIAMPKFNAYRALHTTVIGPQGRPLEIQVRTSEMHATAEFGVAAHWLYKGRKKHRDDEWTAWVRQLMDEGTTDEADPREFMKSFRTDLFGEEVHVFTPKGQVKTLPAGSTPIDLPYAKLRGSSVLAQVIRDSGFKKAEDFYLALGSGKLSAGAIVNKVIQRLKVDEVVEEAPVVTKAPRARDAVSGDDVGVVVQGV